VIHYNNRYSTTTLISNAVPYDVLHNSSNVPPRHKSLGRGCLLFDVPASNASPPLLPRTIWNDVCVQSLLGAKRGENHWVSNLANMADGVTPPIVNPESASRYDGQLWCCRYIPEDDRQRRFLRITGLSWCRFMSLHITILYYTTLYYTKFRFSIEWLCIINLVIYTRLLYFSNFSLADPSGRAVQGVGPRRLGYWDCGFGSHRGHGCLSLFNAVRCQVEVCATGRSPVRRSLIECGVISKSQQWRSLDPLQLSSHEAKNIIIQLNTAN